MCVCERETYIRFSQIILCPTEYECSDYQDVCAAPWWQRQRFASVVGSFLTLSFLFW